MSLILDALKRAERERRADPMPGLDVPGISPPRRRRLWLRIVLGILLALVALLVLAVAVRLVRGKRAPQPPAAMRLLPPKPTAQAPMQAPSPQTGNLVASPAPAPNPRPSVIPGTESVSSLDELSEPEPPPPAVVLPASPTKPQAYTVQPGAAPAAAAPAPAGPALEQDAAQDQAAPKPDVAAPAGEREIPQALTQPAPLRKLREMPPEFRADFPPLNVQVHNYERELAKRFVIVNDRRYHEGETLAEGPHLTEIVKEGMVLEFRGEKLLYSLNR